MSMISLCLPTRGRPDNLERLVRSVDKTAYWPVEIVVYIDEDDRQSYGALSDRLSLMVGPRLTMSDYWNACTRRAKGDILMLCADDIVFQTPEWDAKVEAAFSASPDPFVMVHGDDGQPNGANHATHPFLHRRWIETLGYFTPPYFVSDYADTWLNELANGIGRRIYLPEVKTEHMHFSLGKSEMDATYAERAKRHAEANPAKLYEELAPERARDIEKLKAAIASYGVAK